MRRFGIACVAVGALLLLAGCGEPTGTVLNVYGEEVTKATTKCTTSWSVSIQKEDGSIVTDCVTKSTMDTKQYEPGDPYP